MNPEQPSNPPAPRVSIVLPNYNYARYLDERITSLLRQTFTDFELIVTDDASKDSSREVIAKYAGDPRLRTLYFEKNSGSVYRRWNDGAAIARGEYLIFAGADDSCEPTLLERLVGLLDAHPNVGFAYSQVWITDSESRRMQIKQYATDPEHWAADYVARGTDEVRDYMYLRNTVPNASSVLMRRALFEEAGRFELSLQLSADWMLWAKLALRADVAYVADPLVDFRIHAGTVRMSSAKGLRHVDDDYRVVSYIAQHVDLDAPRLERVREKMAALWADYLSLGCGLNDPKKLRSIYDNARRFDPRLGSRLLRHLRARGAANRSGRRLVWAAKGSIKRAAKSVVGIDLESLLRNAGVLAPERATA